MTDCPDIEILVALAKGALDDSAMASEIAAHAGECSECMGFIDDVLAGSDLAPKPGVTPPADELLTIDRDALRLRTASAHMTPTLLAAFCDGTLTGTSEELVMEHLAICKTCADAMLDLTDRANPEASWADFVKEHGAELGFESAAGGSDETL